MTDKEARNETEKVLNRYREYLLVLPKEKHPLIRGNFKIEFPLSFEEGKKGQKDKELHDFITFFVAAFNRLPQSDRHLLSYKYLRTEHRNDYGGRGSCTSYRAAAELGVSTGGFYSKRKKALEMLALSLGIKPVNVFKDNMKIVRSEKEVY